MRQSSSMPRCQPTESSVGSLQAETTPISGSEGSLLSRLRVSCLHFFAVAVLLCFLAGQVVPLPIRKANKLLLLFADQAPVLIGLLSGLAFLASIINFSNDRDNVGGLISFSSLLFALNVIPVLVAVATLQWSLESENCPVAEHSIPPQECSFLATLLDTVGLLSARIARLDLCVCWLLASRGESAWVYGITGGWIGFSEAIPLHRTAGWWCAMQCVLHSAAYLLFYFATGGLSSLWLDCFPAALNGKLNSLGLVNFLGILALAMLAALALSAVPSIRRRYYHVFQLSHLPVSVLFTFCCSLHDFPMLLFSLPGLACWWQGWRPRSGRSGRRFAARAHLLAGTSGPWIQITTDCAWKLHAAPPGWWVSLRVVPLGREWHPLSLTLADDPATQLCIIVSARGGDWSERLGALARSLGTSSFEVELAGPFPIGGGRWSFHGASRAGDRVLLLAGGTGVTAWLPALAASEGLRCHLVWCVQCEADFRALSSRIPRKASIRVTVYVTRAAETAGRQTSVVDGGLLALPRFHPSVESSSTGAPLFMATLIGLSVGHWGWRYVGNALRSWTLTTMTGYLIVRRCVPIAMVVASIIATIYICNQVRICRLIRKRFAGRVAWPIVTPSQPHGTLLSSTQQLVRSDVNFTVDDAREHDLRQGRPNFDALVREAASELGHGCLAVAACGPTPLVQAAKRAVATSRQEFRNVRMTFAGSEPNW